MFASSAIPKPITRQVNGPARLPPRFELIYVALSSVTEGGTGRRRRTEGEIKGRRGGGREGRREEDEEER